MKNPKDKMKKMKYPFVSIIVVNFNRKNWLKICLNSLKTLNYPKNQYEVIVVDNGSTDGSVKFLKKNFPWVRVLSLDKNYGASEGKNIGIKKSKGDYFYCLDSDVRVDKDCLIEMIEVVEKDKSIGVCGSKIIGFNNLIQTKGNYLNFLGTPIHRGRGIPNKYDNEIKEVFWVSTCSILIRRNILEKLKYLFDPSYFVYYEDTDFCWRVNLAGYKVVYVPKSVVWHRHKKEVTSYSIFVTYKNKIISFRKNLRTPIKQILLMGIIVRTLLAILYWKFKGKWKYGSRVFRSLFTPINYDINLNLISLKRQISLFSLKLT